MKDYLNLVKFSHTIFALPFALVGFFLAVSHPLYEFSWPTLLLVLGCMVFGRNAAMAFNRWLDRDIDAQNERTTIREIPAGKLSASSVLLFVILNCIGFVLCSAFLNTLCLILSPVALLVILGYSYTKRFTSFCHLVLGLGLSLAPIGAYIAVTGTITFIPILIGLGVLFWVAGFDIIYALQDVDFDKSLNLNSTPVKIGKKNALLLSLVFHFVTAFFLSVASYMVYNNYDSVGLLLLLGLTSFILLLFYQHTLVKSDDLTKVNLAFFTTNGIASVIFGSLFIIDLLF